MERVPKNIKSGRNIVTQDQDEIILRSFVNAFIAVIWRRNWITIIMYSKHNDCNISSDLIRKCLQYNVFDETGIGNLLKPYFKYSAFSGLLDLDSLNIDNDILKDELERILQIFPESYRIEINDSDESLNFIMDYGRSVFSDIESLVLEIKRLEKLYENNDNTNDENKDNDENENNDKDENKDNTNTKDESHCKMCNLIDQYENDLDVNHCEDRYMNIIIEGMMSCL